MNELQVQAAIDEVERCLRQGEPLLAYNAVQEGLRAWPRSVRLRQLQGLALARSGDVERANSLLRELAAEGIVDAETLGMLARTHKDLALRTRVAATRNAQLAAAFGCYFQAYEVARSDGRPADAWYTGINAAAIAVLQGELATARRIAAEVRELCTSAQAQSGATPDYWREATLGEAALILGNSAESAAHYARAASIAAGHFGNLASTRRQAELLAQCLPGRSPWIAELLRIPPVLMYAGQGCGKPESATCWGPLDSEVAVAAGIRERLATLRPMAAYGALACGADILCLEALQELGVETHIVLPFPPAEYHRTSAEFGASSWTVRLERVLAVADTVTVTSDHCASGSAATYEYSQLVLGGMARLRAERLQTELCTLAGSPDAAGSRAAPGPVAAEARLPPGFTHEIRAMLFADAVGYSKLTEDQTASFVTGFLGAVAELNGRTAHRPEHVETSGDGLYMVFAGVHDAGCYALQLNQLAGSTDWAARGLPGGLILRIALHCGPVYCGRNPVTGAPLYTGPHTNRTARIEPITPPGQVYASSAFAAVAAARGVDGLAMQYIGRMPLAKSYGSLGLYHLRPAQEPASEAANGLQS